MAHGCHLSNQMLKDKFTQKKKFSHCVIALMAMASQVKFRSPQNIR